MDIYVAWYVGVLAFVFGIWLLLDSTKERRKKWARRRRIRKHGKDRRKVESLWRL